MSEKSAQMALGYALMMASYSSELYRPSIKKANVEVIEENVKTDKIVYKYEAPKLKKHQELGTRKLSRKQRKSK